MRGLLLWGPVVAFMVAVLTVPGPALAPVHVTVWDKASHFVAYGIFGFFCLRALHGGMHRPRRRAVTVAFLLAIGFAAFDEIQQLYRPQRYGSLGDWVADALGILTALPIFAACARICRRVPGAGDST